MALGMRNRPLSHLGSLSFLDKTEGESGYRSPPRPSQAVRLDGGGDLVEGRVTNLEGLHFRRAFNHFR